MTLFQIEFEDSAIKSEDIKEVYKVRLILDPTQERTQDLYWFLDRVITAFWFKLLSVNLLLVCRIRYTCIYSVLAGFISQVLASYSAYCILVLAMIKN